MPWNRSVCFKFCNPFLIKAPKMPPKPPRLAHRKRRKIHLRLRYQTNKPIQRRNMTCNPMLLAKRFYPLCKRMKRVQNASKNRKICFGKINKTAFRVSFFVFWIMFHGKQKQAKTAPSLGAVFCVEKFIFLGYNNIFLRNRTACSSKRGIG